MYFHNFDSFKAKSLFPTTNDVKPEIKSILADSTTSAFKLPTLQPVEIPIIPACNQIVVEETQTSKMGVSIQPIDVKMTCSLSEKCDQNVVEETQIPKMNVLKQPIDVEMAYSLPEECDQNIVEEAQIPKMDVLNQTFDVEMECSLPEVYVQNVVGETQIPELVVFKQPFNVEMACLLPEENAQNILCTAISPEAISQRNRLQAEDFDSKVSTNVTIDFETKADENLMVSPYDFEGCMEPSTSSTSHNLMEGSIENILESPMQLHEQKSLLEATSASISTNPNSSLDATMYEVQKLNKQVHSTSQSSKTTVTPLRIRKIPKNVNDNVASVDIADSSFQYDPVAEPSYATHSPVVESTTNIRMRFPKSPRVILQRISSIEEYNMLVLGHKESRGQTKKPRKPRTKTIQKKGKFK